MKTSAKPCSRPTVPLLVLAGAGTGKTRVLTTRLAHIIVAQGLAVADPAVTFTNKAAREMRAHAAVIGEMVEGMPWLGTFHSICAKILRRHAELIGLKHQLHDPRHRRPAASAQADH
jgi:DNA helicase-2/ATP-dependent DNA helicase PcrA